MLNGEFTVAGGDRRFRLVSGGARGQGLRLRQMGDADGVFSGDSVSAVVALNAVVLLVVLVAEKDRL